MNYASENVSLALKLKIDLLRKRLAKRTCNAASQHLMSRQNVRFDYLLFSNNNNFINLSILLASLLYRLTNLGQI